MSDEIEQQLWQMLKDATNDEPYRKARISRLADQRLAVPNKQWVTQTVRKWSNRGLVIAYKNGAVASLTEEGVRTEEIIDG